MQKADEIKQAFLDWVWTDDERRDLLTRLYNEKFNTNVPPAYDGSHLELVGASEAVKLRPHQKNAVWRAIQEGTCLFDHVVGAGKTLACVATVMESKRMGFLSKHPTTQKPIPSPFINIGINYMNQAVRLWNEIFQIVKENCSTDYGEVSPQDDLMERLLRARKG